jgi:eight-cysteine-cluster-containing protein
MGALCPALACMQTPVSGGCVRSSGDACVNDADCKRGGCGGELCYNPLKSSGITPCDCPPPMGLGCGCVNGVCTWWK